MRPGSSLVYWDSGFIVWAGLTIYCLIFGPRGAAVLAVLGAIFFWRAGLQVRRRMREAGYEDPGLFNRRRRR
jgi:hypothetical protein